MYCVYFHINPLKNHIFYVGIGNKKCPYRKDKRSELWNKTVKKYGYIIDIIEEGLTWEDAQKREKFYIKKLGRRDLGLGNLVNLTNGGEGTCGRPASDKARVAIIKRNKGNKYAAGRCWSKELKDKFREIHKGNKYALGYKFTPEQRKKISIALKGKKRVPFTKERKLNQSVKYKGIINTKTLINTDGTLFNSIGVAAEFYCIKRTTLNAMLVGQIKNKTDLRYVRQN